MATDKFLADDIIQLIKLRIKERPSGDCDHWYLVRKYLFWKEYGVEYEVDDPRMDKLDLLEFDYNGLTNPELLTVLEMVIVSYYKE